MREGATYRAALASAEFRAVFGAAGLSVCGNVVADVAQTVLIFDRTSSPLLASLAFALGSLPYLATGTMLSGLVDRVPPRRLLVTGYLLAAALTAVMALPGMPVAVLLALTFAAGFANGLGGATRGALVRAVVSQSAYVPAQSLMRISSQVAQLAANPLGGFLVVLASARGAFGVAAGILVIAAAIARLGVRAGAGVREDVPGGAAAGPAAVGAAADGIAPAGGVTPADGIAPARADLLGDSLRGMREVFALPAAGLLSFLPYLVFFTAPPVFACIPLLALSGMCSMYSLGLDARVRAACPEGLFARMMAVNSAGMMTIQALGFCLAGLIGGLTRPGIAVGIAGAAGIAGTLLLWPLRMSDR